MKILTTISTIACSLSIILANAPSLSQDYEREAKHAENIEEALIIGDPIYLTSAAEPDHEFISLLTESEDSESTAAVIIVHGSGIHPNWPDLVHPLRATLPEHGYTTLAVQMPVPGMEAEYDAYLPLLSLAQSRLQAAQTYLTDEGYKPIYMIAHSMGAAMATWSLAEPTKGSEINGIDGIILIGSADLRNFGVDNIVDISKLTIPVADIYGSDDLPTVMKAKDYRAEQGATLERFSQQVIPNADHMFSAEHSMSLLTESILAILTSWQD